MAFGLGWLVSASRATSATPTVTADDGGGRHHRAFQDLAYVTALVFALVVGLFVVGGLLARHEVGLYVFCLVVILTALMIVHWQAPRSESGVNEVARSVFLSVPILLPLAAVAALLVAAGASTSSSAPSFLLVPLPFAAAGTLWLIGLLMILAARLGRVPGG